MILVTGANGQLGQELQRSHLPAGTLFLTRDQLDITNLSACQRLIAEHGITTVINAAAYTQVDKAESEPDLAFAINHTGTANLAKALATETNGTLLHISTDYVFNGQSSTPYTEDMPTSPTTVYGQSKRKGEEDALEFAPTAIVLRTSWLYSALGGGNFVKTMLRLGAERAELNVVFDQTGTPTSAQNLATDIAKILPLIKPNEHEIFHYSNEGTASWYDFATTIMQLANLPCKVLPIRSAQYPTPAQRPAYSVLDKSKFKSYFNTEISHWHTPLAKCIKEITSR